MRLRNQSGKVLRTATPFNAQPVFTGTGAQAGNMTMERNNAQGILIQRVPTIASQFKLSLLGIHSRVKLLHKEVIKGLARDR